MIEPTWLTIAGPFTYGWYSYTNNVLDKIKIIKGLVEDLFMHTHTAHKIKKFPSYSTVTDFAKCLGQSTCNATHKVIINIVLFSVTTITAAIYGSYIICVLHNIM